MAKKKPTRLEKTAYHEAGHAVMASHLGRAVKLATIVPDDGGGLGHVKFYVRKPLISETDAYMGTEMGAGTERRIDHEVLIDIAGLVAEWKFSGRHNWKWAGEDLHRLVDRAMFRCASPKEAGLYIDWLKFRCESILCGPMLWPVVQVVARELLKHKTLGAQRIRKIIGSAYGQLGK